jgi:hypothetical protein
MPMAFSMMFGGMSCKRQRARLRKAEPVVSRQQTLAFSPRAARKAASTHLIRTHLGIGVDEGVKGLGGPAALVGSREGPSETA